MTGHDTEFLKQAVGEALSRGVAAVVAAGPVDHVEYLGQWLHTYVRNVKLQQGFMDELALEAAQSEKAAKRAGDAQQEIAQVITDKAAALQQIADLEGYPVDIWKCAAEVILAHTKVASSYVAVVSTPAEPDFQWPEAEEGEGEEEAAPETDDEAEDAPPPVAEKPEEGEEPAAEEEAAEDDEAAPPKVTTAPVDPEAVQQRVWDYRAHRLEYVAAAPQHQAFLLSEVSTLDRPPPPPEDADDDYVAPSVPVTMRMLDEHLPTLYVSSTADEPRAKPLGGFPALGAYYAAAAVQASNRYSTVLCVDTLVPHGSAAEISDEDRDFVGQVARAVAAKLEVFVQERIAARAASTVGEEAGKLKEKLKDMRAAALPAPPAAETAAAKPAADDEGEGEPAAEGEGAAEPEEEEALEAEEGEAGEEPVKPDPAKQIAKLTKQIAKLDKEIGKQTAAKEGAEAKCSSEVACLTEVRSHLAVCKDAALKELKGYFTAPPATFHVLQAILYLLGKEASDFSTWSRTWSMLDERLFADLESYNAEQPRIADQWKLVRGAYKAVPKDKAQPLWTQELPVTGLGAFLMIYIKQVRRVGNAAAVLRAINSKLETATTGKADAGTALSSAEADKAAADAAKPPPAAEQAAEGDEAAAAEGEEEETEE